MTDSLVRGARTSPLPDGRFDILSTVIQLGGLRRTDPLANGVEEAEYDALKRLRGGAGSHASRRDVSSRSRPA
ncbi:hypothetical protein MKEN_00034900 [Mycena kentingensis (nom. inval.)]|nr:hypothetical protein MKEN_00034900 [Mycena kentingensis (nom. inval.)]